MESGDRLYRASAYAHFSGGMGDTVNTRMGLSDMLITLLYGFNEGTN